MTEAPWSTIGKLAGCTKPERAEWRRRHPRDELERRQLILAPEWSQLAPTSADFPPQRRTPFNRALGGWRYPTPVNTGPPSLSQISVCCPRTS